MRAKSLFAVALASAVATSYLGCAKAPGAEVNQAKAAIEAAKAAEAESYVAEQYKSASDSLNAALAAIEKQNSAFALSRNYTDAKRQLASAVELANKATADAAAAKEAKKAENEKMIVDAKAALDSARLLLQKAPKGKEGAEALTAISTDLSVVDSSLVQASNDMTAGSYAVARDKITAAQEKTASITTELTTAIEKASAGKKKAGK